MEIKNPYLKYYISALSLIAYVVLFYILIPFIGISFMIFSIIPILIISWFFNFRYGIIVQVLLIVHRFIAFHFLELDIKSLMTFEIFIGTASNLLLIFGLFRLKKLFYKIDTTESKYREVVNNMSDIYYKTDGNGKILMVNPAAVKVFGYSNQREIIGRDLTDDFYKIPEDKEFFRKQISKTGIINNFKTILRHKDGSDIYLEINARIIQYNNNIEIEGIARDITRRIHAEKALKKSEQKLKESNTQKDKFFSIIAHDLRNPFHSILGFSKFLITGFGKYNDEKLLEIYHHLNDSAGQAYELLENLLEWANSQQGIMPFEKVENNLFELVSDEVLKLKDAAALKEIDLKFEVKKELVIVADVNMLRSILRNLLSNAIKFTDKKGKINLKANQIRDYIEFTVKDNGIGMNDQQVINLFHFEKTISSSGTENESGTGLGLVLCKEFVEKHGGKIWVESGEGKGSEFIFTLPLS